MAANLDFYIFRKEPNVPIAYLEWIYTWSIPLRKEQA